MNKRFQKVPLAARWVGGAALLGIVLAYQPAISQSTGFTLPFTGDATAQGVPVVSFTNDATSGSASDGLYAFTSSTDTASVGLYGSSQGGPGVMGYANSAANTAGLYGQADGNSGYGVYGVSSGANSNGQILAAGVYGFSATATGVAGVSSSSVDAATYGLNTNGASGVYGQGDNGGNGVTGLTRFSTMPGVYGTNISTGGVTMGVQGQSSSVTGYGVVGGFAPVYVDKELQDNRFQVGGGRPGMKISWQVTGTRQDAYAKAHPCKWSRTRLARSGAIISIP